MSNKTCTWFLQLNKLIEKINNLSQDFDVYAVGGFSRDLLLKRKCNDIDLVVNRNALEYSEKIAGLFKTKFITLDDVNKTYRIILKNSVFANIDISLLNGKIIEEDLQNRDFTVNAIGFNLKNFVDFKKHIILADNNALRDLDLKVINTVSSKSFVLDPVRILRAFRFSAELNFNLSKEALDQIKQNIGFIIKAAPERIRNELFRILAVKNSTKLIADMDKYGLLSEIFPEIKKMKKANKKYYYHSNGLFQHSFETMQSVENILNNLKKYFPLSYTDIQKHFDSGDFFSEYISRSGLLKFTALFHDNAKPETAEFRNGKMHFFKHEEYGAKKMKAIMDSLKFSKKDIEFSTSLIKNHMRPSTLTRNNIVTKKAALRFFRDIGDKTVDLLVLSTSDWYSYKKLKVFSYKKLKFQEKHVRNLLKYYFELKNTKPLPKIIDGDIIMKKFHLKPGPWIGELLKIVIQSQEERKVSNIDEILKLIFSKLTQVKKKYRI
ncbi:MAG: HD domain-containing protein [Endomicrobium sp.]|jgi:poly(A) polymerase|nr:HD domain-containing protein [Endomicrobium sp.]